MFNQFGNPQPYAYPAPAAGFAPWGQNQTQLQRMEIIRVNGENGARAFQMAPNSSVMLLDESAPLVWLAQTDGAGYKTVTPYTITPYQAAPAPDYSSLVSRIERLEGMLNGQKPNAGNAGAVAAGGE